MLSDWGQGRWLKVNQSLDMGIDPFQLLIIFLIEIHADCVICSRCTFILNQSITHQCRTVNNITMETWKQTMQWFLHKMHSSIDLFFLYRERTPLKPKFIRPCKTMACFAWVSTYDVQVAEYTTIITMSVYIILRNYRYIFGLTKFQLVRYLNFPPYPL